MPADCCSTITPTASTPPTRNVYRCVFYESRLGINFKFQNGKAYVSSYDENSFEVKKKCLRGSNSNNKTTSASNLMDQALNNTAHGGIVLNKDIDNIPVRPPVASELAMVQQLSVTRPPFSPDPTPPSTATIPTASVVVSTASSASSAAVYTGDVTVAESVVVLGSSLDQDNPFDAVQKTTVLPPPRVAPSTAKQPQQHHQQQQQQQSDEIKEETGDEDAVVSKIVVQCDEVFGKDSKKVCKLPIPSSPQPQQIERLVKTLRSKYPVLPANRVLQLQYWDAEVCVLADLDNKESWAEFISQDKKCLTISLGDVMTTTTAGPAPALVPTLSVLVSDSSCSASSSPNNAIEDAACAIETVHNNSNSPCPSPPPSPVAAAAVSPSPPRPALGSHIYSINAVKVIGLDKEFVVGLLKQQQRPMIIEFVVTATTAVGNSTAAMAGQRQQGQDTKQTTSSKRNGSSGDSSVSGPSAPLSSGRAAITKIPFDLFQGKYMHSLAETLRRKVSKWMEEYTHGDWAGARAAGGGMLVMAADGGGGGSSRSVSTASSSGRALSTNSSRGGGNSSDDASVLLPGQFVISIYRFVQQKLEKCGLFDNSLPQGGGLPVMGAEQWDEIQDHIERLVCAPIYSFTVAVLAPKYREGGGQLNARLTRLRFITLEHLGLYATRSPNYKKSSTAAAAVSEMTTEEGDIGRGGDDDGDVEQQLQLKRRGSFPSYFSPSADKRYLAALAALPDQEEWRLAMKELCKAVTDGEQCCTPASIMKRFVAASNIIAHATEAYLSQGATAAGGIDSAEIDADAEARSLSADELLPALAWTVIQANPPDLDYILWFCEEFRHPDRMHGEAAYALAQLSSAVSFCLSIEGAESLDMSSEDFSCFSMQHDLTQELLSACRRGNLNLIRACLGGGTSGNSTSTTGQASCCCGGGGVRLCADINGFDPTQRDRPLSCCVRNQQLEAARLLLSLSSPLSSESVNDTVVSGVAADTSVHDCGTVKVKVNARLSPCQGGAEGGFTALHLAALSGQLDMVVLLLLHGADRYLLDDKGCTPLALAVTADHKAVVNVLLADPRYSSLIDHIRGNNLLLVEGLIRQQVDVNALTEDGTSFALLEAVRTGNMKMLKFLMKSSSSSTTSTISNAATTAAAATAPLRINRVNVFGESALMYLAYVDASDLFPADTPVDYESLLVSLVTTLLEAGAKRNLRSGVPGPNATSSSCGKSALDMCRDELVRLQKRQQQQQQSREEEYTELAKMHRHELPTRDLPSFCRGLVAVINILKYDPEELQLCEAARLRLPDAVEALCLQGVDMNVPDPAKGYTALIAAVFNEDVPMLRLLLRFGCASIRQEKGGRQQNGTNNKNQGKGKRGIKNDSQDTSPQLALVSPGRMDINRPGRNGMRALHYAAQCGSPVICGLLLEFGADRALVNDQNHSAMDVATMNGHNEAANVLRYNPAEVPITLAAKHGDWVVLKSLLYQGVDINGLCTTQFEKGSNNTLMCHELATVLIATVAYRQEELLKCLFATSSPDSGMAPYTSDVIQVDMCNGRGETALMHAALIGNENMVLRLLRHGADRRLKDTGGRTALDLAIAKGHSAGLLHVLQYDPRQVWIHDVIRAQCFKGVVALLKQRVDVNVRRFRDSKIPNCEIDDESGAGVAVPVLKLPAADVAPVTMNSLVPVTDGELPFTVAAACNAVEIITLLLKCPELDINRTDGCGRSALFHAAMNGHESTVVLLLKHKAQRKTMDFSRLSALDSAISKGHLQVAALLQADPVTVHIHDMCAEGKVLMVQALLLQGCPVNYQDERTGSKRETPLLAACAAGKIDVTKLLLSQPNILVDIPDTEGRTPLMAAAGVGALNITALLLTAGCDRTAVDSEGKTAKDYAYDHGIGTRMSFMSQLMMY